MKLVRNSKIDVNMVEIIKRSSSFFSRGEEIIERSDKIIDKKDPDKLLKEVL